MRNADSFRPPKIGPPEPHPQQGVAQENLAPPTGGGGALASQQGSKLAKTGGLRGVFGGLSDAHLFSNLSFSTSFYATVRFRRGLAWVKVGN